MNTGIQRSGQQIPLPFRQFESLDFEQFLSGANQEAVQSVMQIADGGLGTRLYLWGATGTGKSHLLQAACKRASDAGLNVAYIPLSLLGDKGPELLEGLEQLDLICVDDLNGIAGRGDWEEALLHLYNRIHDAGRSLIMTSSENPRGSSIQLNDLKSRLSWGLVFHLQPLSDADKIRLIKQRAGLRGFEIPDEVADYLIKRVSRELINLLQLLETIDHTSLAEQRRITIPFIKSLLAQSLKS